MAAITFACGATTGGAVQSTVSLAEEAVAAGHEVQVVIASEDPYARLPRLTAGLVRLDRASKALGEAAWRVHDRLSSATTADGGPLAVHRASDVPAAVGRLHELGALLVVNSVRHLDLRRLLELAARRRSPTVWYLREEASLATLAKVARGPDVLIANSRPLAEEAERLSGRPCTYVPSVISRDGLVEPAEREVLLAINPIPSHGSGTVVALARAIPQRRFVLQESWPLSEEELAGLRRAVEAIPNLELRRRADRSEIYRDAWALLLPHSGPELGGARPRVALEAQLLGIPVLAHAIPGLAATAASPELLVREGAVPEEWREAIDRLERGYEAFSVAARAFADREMPSAREVWDAFAAAAPCDLA